MERCLKYKEPVLLVGETGCGKTTVCQVFSLVLGQRLSVINCHQHTETADFLGGLRPVRGKERTLTDLRTRLHSFYQALSAAKLPLTIPAHDSKAYVLCLQPVTHCLFLTLDRAS